MTGIAAIQSRIAEIQSMVAPTLTTVAPAATARSALGASTTATSTTATSATGTDFARALAALTGQAPSTATVSGTVTGEALVDAATQYQGTPYVWGGESLAEGGLDCSGLVQRALADLGVTDIPRTAREQMTLGEEVPSLDQARPGDLVVFGGGTHIGIYVGDGQMIDAPKRGDHVRVRDVYTEPTTIRRILPSAAETAATTGSGAAASAAAGRAALALLGGTA
ncbi:C40 family peptidase [Cellulomonas sp. NPDC089187]|uniref:C40 family peptidase n=1 Tax=Cellulomonas sp. NPDC089187 TaxID=3154970 RepID=UPI003439A869